MVILLFNHSTDKYTLPRGFRVAQMVVESIMRPDMYEYESAYSIRAREYGSFEQRSSRSEIAFPTLIPSSQEKQKEMRARAKYDERKERRFNGSYLAPGKPFVSYVNMLTERQRGAQGFGSTDSFHTIKERAD